MPKRQREEKEIDIILLQECPMLKTERVVNTLYRRVDDIVKRERSGALRLWCKHDRRKEACIDCDGISMCEHKRERARCKDCNGTAICLHGRARTRCKDCKGGGLCPHFRERHRCIQCKGTGICNHNRRRNECKDCKGTSICEHEIVKHTCYRCSIVSHPQNFCPLCKMVFTRDKKYDKYERHCAACFQYLHPDVEFRRRTHLKEDALAEFLHAHYGGEKWTRDSTLHGGCSARRPDFVCDLLTHVIVVENDEFEHRDRKEECENRRAMEIYQDLAFRPLVCIRFNPDSYVDADGVRHTGCFSYSTTGALDKDEALFAERCAALVEVIDKYLATIPEKAFTEEFLFYSEE